MESPDLHDLGYKGPSFTWHRGGVHERLDKAIGNNAWIEAFPHYLVSHLPRIKPDHRPLLMSLRSDVIPSRGRPFRFFTR